MTPQRKEWEVVEVEDSSNSSESTSVVRSMAGTASPAVGISQREQQVQQPMKVQLRSHPRKKNPIMAGANHGAQLWTWFLFK
jgi:hypothetical protein